MAGENIKIDNNNRNGIAGLANDGSGNIFNARINPNTGALVVEATVTSSNTSITSTIPGGTAGSVLFLGAGSTLDEDNANFFYDYTDHYLGLGTTSPTAPLHVVGSGGFRYVDGGQSANYVLISSASGVASWTNLAVNSAFVTNLINNNTFTTNLANNSNFYTTLGANNSFITDVTNNSTFQTNVTNFITTGGGVLFETNGTPNGSQAILNLVAGSNISIVDDGTGDITITGTGGGGGGTVTSVSVVSANGFAGTVANSTTTPAITLKTSITGTLQGNGTAISASKVVLTQPATSSTLTILNGKTLTANNTIVLAGTDSTTMTFPSTSASIARTDAAQTFTGTQTFSQIVTTSNAITASGNAATVPITSRISTVTNNSAATLTITITTASAVDGQMVMVRILDATNVAQTITWVNTEDSTVTAPTTSNGSTTLPLTVGFQFNGNTSLWRTIAVA